MNRMINKVLGVALIAQIGLVALTWGTRGSAPRTDARPLIEAIEPDQVTGLRVESAPANGKPAQVVELAKKGDDWVLPGADDYPADAKKVDKVLEALFAGRIRAPIASNAANHNALEVGDRSYTRKVKLTAGNSAVELVVGAARGTAAHVRRAGEEPVYLARGFSATALEDTPAPYLDTTYLDVEAPDQIVVKNPRGTLTLNKVEGNWTLAELPPGTPGDPERFTAFVGAARKLIIDAPVGKTVKPEYGLDTPLAAHVTIKAGEKTYTYSLGAMEDGKRYLKREDNDWVVLVPTFSVSNLMDQVPQSFIKEDRPEVEAPLDHAHQPHPTRQVIRRPPPHQQPRVVHGRRRGPIAPHRAEGALRPARELAHAQARRRRVRIGLPEQDGIATGDPQARHRGPRGPIAKDLPGILDHVGRQDRPHVQLL